MPGFHSESAKKTASPRSGKPPARESMSQAFNARSSKASEIELKFLVPDKDRTRYASIEKYFMDKGWIKLARKNAHLLTRQLDTPKRHMLKNGHTLRIRGNCVDDRLDQVEISDICLKTGTTHEQSGALSRGEYEARTRSFNSTDLSRLTKKYPKDEHPELHNALRGLKARDLREYFRIDCYRDRYVVELPDSVTGVKGKKFCAELIMDDVAYVMDIPGLKMPLIFHHDLEVECEALFKPCDYDDHPDKTKYVSSPMTAKQADKALSAIKRHIEKAGGGTLVTNSASKAERGFTALDATIEALREFVIANERAAQAAARKGQKPTLTSAFTLSAKSYGAEDDQSQELNGKPVVKLHKHLPRPMGYVLRQRAIAIAPAPSGG